MGLPRAHRRRRPGAGRPPARLTAALSEQRACLTATVQRRRYRPGTPSGSSGSSSGDASSDGSGSTSSGASGDGGGVPPPPVPGCSQTATWGNQTLLAISTPEEDDFDAITPDELTIVWSVGGQNGNIYVADRADANGPFGGPQAILATNFAVDRVALSPDGLRLVVVNGGSLGFSELMRSSRGGTFGAPATGLYGNFDTAGALAAGELYGDPVIDAHDLTFFYSVYASKPDAGAQSKTIYRTTRLTTPPASGPLGAPLVLDASLALGSAGRQAATAERVISSDNQTLFFWDEVAGSERAAWLTQANGVFDTFVDLGARTMAAPNSTCTHLYYSTAGTSSVDLLLRPV